MASMNKKFVQIHSFKHDKKLHRIWNNIKILEENDKILVAGNNKSRVYEANGRSWTTKEPAICIFYKEYWFNVIGMLKKDGIYFYCNLSSPFIRDEEAIKYIDYDLDVKVFPDYTYTILDRDEYEEHMRKMNYPEKLKTIIEHNLKELLKMIEEHREPFSLGYIQYWYNLYQKNVDK